jgi:hypothetical protein
MNMAQDRDFLITLHDFLYPHYQYHGQFKPEYIAFNANLQEFSQRVSYICNLQTSGKLSPEDAYAQIKNLWKQLKISKKHLNV